MILFPAIDIRGGRAVRLRQGNFDEETVYADDPLEAARDWVSAGARFLHVVDLDGAKTGEPAAFEHLRAISEQLAIPVQYGGGLRTIEAVRGAFEAGAARAIVGTAAFRDMDFLDACVVEFGTRMAVAVDVRGGFISTAGWTETGSLPAVEAIERLQDRGVRSFVYTDADRDGMLEGPSLEDVSAVAGAVRGRFVYSGGIGTLDHLRSLVALRRVNMAGVIVGKALYEQKFTVAEATAALRG